MSAPQTDEPLSDSEAIDILERMMRDELATLKEYTKVRAGGDPTVQSVIVRRERRSRALARAIDRIKTTPERAQ